MLQASEESLFLFSPGPFQPEGRQPRSMELQQGSLGPAYAMRGAFAFGPGSDPAVVSYAGAVRGGQTRQLDAMLGRMAHNVCTQQQASCKTRGLSYRVSQKKRNILR